MYYNDIKNNIISYCNGSFNKETYDITLNDAIEEIRQAKYLKEVNRYRDTGNETIKQSLKAYLFSGHFCKANDKSINVYNKICVLDFDDINENIEIVKKELSRCVYIFAIWVSPSGRGLKALIMFDYSNFEIENNEEYINLHKIAYKQFLNRVFFPYKLDASGCNISRLCYTSIDKRMIIKAEITPFVLEKEIIPYHGDKKSSSNLKKNLIKTKKTDLNEGDVKDIQHDKNNKNRQKIQSIYKFFKKRKISITSTYFEWFRIGQAIANIFSYIIGKKYFLQLCRLDEDKHDEEKSKKLLIQCYQNSLTYGYNKVKMTSIIKAAKKQGWSPKHKRNSGILGYGVGKNTQ